MDLQIKQSLDRLEQINEALAKASEPEIASLRKEAGVLFGAFDKELEALVAARKDSPVRSGT